MLTETVIWHFLMRDFPSNITEFKEKHNLQSEIEKDQFDQIAEQNLIFRNDFVFISFLDDIKAIGINEEDLNMKIEKVFPRSTRIQKWKEFQNCSNLIIEDLNPSGTKILSFITLIIITSSFFIYKILSNPDLSIFTLLHPETLTIGFIGFFMIFWFLDFLLQKIKPQKEIPILFKNERFEEVLIKIIQNNRYRVKNEFQELFGDKYREIVVKNAT